MCNSTYHCPLPFESERIHAAAIYCSDGRFGEHMDDFLHTSLDLPRYDRVVIPGGPARLIERFTTQAERETFTRDLGFLIDAHKLDRLVMIAHSGCAYYTSQFEGSPESIEEAEKQDIVKAGQLIRDTTRLEQIETYFARVQSGRVQFESVE